MNEELRRRTQRIYDDIDRLREQVEPETFCDDWGDVLARVEEGTSTVYDGARVRQLLYAVSELASENERLVERVEGLEKKAAGLLEIGRRLATEIADRQFRVTWLTRYAQELASENERLRVEAEDLTNHLDMEYTRNDELYTLNKALHRLLRS